MQFWEVIQGNRFALRRIYCTFSGFAPEAASKSVPHRKSIRLVLVAVAILAVVFATTLGAVWHTHEHTSEANCAICHLNHQPIDSTLSCDCALPHFTPLGEQPEPQEVAVAQSPVISRVPARAPPLA